MCAHTAFCLSQAMQNFISPCKSVPFVMSHMRVQASLSSPSLLARGPETQVRSHLLLPAVSCRRPELFLGRGSRSVLQGIITCGLLPKHSGNPQSSGGIFAPLVLWQPPDGPARSIQRKPQTPWGSCGSFAVSRQNFLMSTGPWHWECLTDTCQNIRWMQISKARLSLVSWCVCYHSGALYSPSIQGLTDPLSSY